MTDRRARRGCRVGGCPRPARANALCTTHYQQQRRAAPREAIYATGLARRAEVQISDGRMAWWVSRANWQRRGLAGGGTI